MRGRVILPILEGLSGKSKLNIPVLKTSLVRILNKHTQYNSHMLSHTLFSLDGFTKNPLHQIEYSTKFGNDSIIIKQSENRHLRGLDVFIDYSKVDYRVEKAQFPQFFPSRFYSEDFKKEYSRMTDVKNFRFRNTPVKYAFIFIVEEIKTDQYDYIMRRGNKPLIFVWDSQNLHGLEGGINMYNIYYQHLSTLSYKNILDAVNKEQQSMTNINSALKLVVTITYHNEFGKEIYALY